MRLANSPKTRITRSEPCNCRPRTSVSLWKPTLPTGRTCTPRTCTRRQNRSSTSWPKTPNSWVRNWARKWKISTLWETSCRLSWWSESNRPKSTWNSTRSEICIFYWISTCHLASPIRTKWITDRCWENIGMNWSNKLKPKPRNSKEPKTISWRDWREILESSCKKFLNLELCIKLKDPWSKVSHLRKLWKDWTDSVTSSKLKTSIMKSTRREKISSVFRTKSIQLWNRLRLKSPTWISCTLSMTPSPRLSLLSKKELGPMSSDLIWKRWKKLQPNTEICVSDYQKI